MHAADAPDHVYAGSQRDPIQVDRGHTSTLGRGASLAIAENYGSRSVGAPEGARRQRPYGQGMTTNESNTGDGLMSEVTFIQRLDTVGGIAPPATTCDAGHIGDVADVPYTATYAFYEARGGRGH